MDSVKKRLNRWSKNLVNTESVDECVQGHKLSICTSGRVSTGIDKTSSILGGAPHFEYFYVFLRSARSFNVALFLGFTFDLFRLRVPCP